MKPTKSIAKRQREISAVKEALQELGPIHPGSVSMQYQVCGRTGCRCMDPDHPRRHGPYHKLAYVHHGKPVCRFVRADCADEVKQRVATYKTFRKLMDRWIELSILQAQVEFFSPATKPKRKRPKSDSSPEPTPKTKRT